MNRKRKYRNRYRHKMHSLVSVIILLLILPLLPLWQVKAATATGTEGSVPTNVNQALGTYQTAIPIQVPSYYGLEPQIALAYNSNAGNGIVGVGWQLAVGSQIQRASPGGGAPRFDGNDEFYLDGEALVPDTTFGGTYSTRQQSYRHITFADGENRWYVRDPNGVTHIYRPSDWMIYGIYQWQLEESIGPGGVHNVTYNYMWDGSRSYLETITYNGTEIKFYYELRPDKLRPGNGDHLDWLHRRLKSVTVVSMRGDKGLVRAYALAYNTSGTTGRSVLSSVQECGHDANVNTVNGVVSGGTCLPPTTFTTQDGGMTTFAGGAWASNTMNHIYNGGGSAEDYRTLTGDFNGDGQTDIATIRAQAPPGIGWHDWLAVDLANGSGFTAETWGALLPMHMNNDGGAMSDFTILTGDFNGDGQTDIAGLRAYAPPGNGFNNNIYMELSTGNAQTGFQSVAWAAELPTHMWNDQGQMQDFRVMTGDFNGDGLTDIAALRAQAAPGNGFNGTIYMELSNGNGFTHQAWPALIPAHMWNGGGQMEDFTVLPGDFNGDGLTDIAALRAYAPPGNGFNSNIYMELSNGAGFNSKAWSAFMPAHMWNDGGRMHEYTVVPGDFNGDGKTDIAALRAGRGPGNGWHNGVYMELSTGDDFSSHQWQTNLPAHMGSTSATSDYGVVSGDYNGDGLSDLFAFRRLRSHVGNGWHDWGWLDISTGLGFDTTRSGPRTYDGPNLYDTNPYDTFLPLSGDFNGDGKADTLLMGWPSVAASGYYNGSNVIREIRGLGNQIQMRVNNGVGEEWATIPLGEGIGVSGQHTFAGSGVTAHNGQSTTYMLNRVREIRGQGASLQLRLASEVDGFSDRWVSVDLAGSDTVVGTHVLAGGAIVPMLTDEYVEDGVSTFISPDRRWTMIKSLSVEAGQLRVSYFKIDHNLNSGHYNFRIAFPGATVTSVQGDCSFSTGQSAQLIRVIGYGDHLDFWFQEIDDDIRVCSIYVAGAIATGDTGQGDKDGIKALGTVGNSLAYHHENFGPDVWKFVTLRPINERRLRQITGTGNQLNFLLENRDNGTLQWVSLTVNGTVMTGASGDAVGSEQFVLWGPGNNSLQFSVPGWPQARAIWFEPANQQQLIQILGQGSALTFVLRNTSTGAIGHYPLTLTGAAASGNTNVLHNQPAMALQGNWGKLNLYFDGWGRWESVALRRTGAEGTPDLYGMLTEGATPDLLIGITNPSGGQTSINYVPSTTWGERQLPGGIWPTVSSVTTSDGRGVSSSTSFWYSGARYDRLAQRFLGFDIAVAIYDNGAKEMVTHFRQTPGCVGQPEHILVQDRHGQGQIYASRFFSYEESSSTPYTCALASVTEFEHGLSGVPRQSRVEYDYDIYGNLIEERDYGDSNVSGDERTFTTTYTTLLSEYIVNLSTSVKLYAGVGTSGQQLQETQIHYHNAGIWIGLPYTFRNWDDQTQQYVTQKTYTYDVYRNVSQVTDAVGRKVAYSYDSKFHQYRTETRSDPNGVNLTTSQTWDTRLRLVNTTTDANGQVTTFTYDALSRPTRVDYANGSWETTAYLQFGIPSAQRIETARSGDSSPSNLVDITYFDGLGRTYKQVQVRLGGNSDLVVDTLYKDATKRPWRQSRPHELNKTAYWMEYAYDGVGRPIQVIYPDGNIEVTQYHVGLVRTIDELGHTTDQHYDVRGNLTQIVEYNEGTSYVTTHQYDLLGHLVQTTDAANNVTRVMWDSLGRKLGMEDPNVGQLSYTYYADGQLASMTDNLNQTTSFTYDSLGRKTHKTYHDATQVVWHYDDATVPNSQGRLTTLTYPDGTLAITAYDALGRITEETRTVDDDGRTFAYGYDLAGRLATLTYPDGEVITYHYDELGQLAYIPNYVGLITYEENNVVHWEKMSYANGTTATYIYDKARGWLTKTQAYKEAQMFFELTLTRLDNGLITSIALPTHPLSNLNFTYDDRNRLTSVSGGQTQTFTYDAIGNITSNSAVGNYSYDDANHVHAVTTAGSHSYSYDANGNMTSAAGRTLTWDSANRLSSVTEGGQTTTFTYGAGESRIQKSGANGTTNYFGREFEVHADGTYTKYIYAGTRLIAQHKQNGEKAWFHHDHLGSTRLLTDENANVIKDVEYAAYGEIVASTGSANSKRDYTGHTTDSESGLIYMQARYYDPILGRFISPDSIVPGANPQALNRYSYTLNNPINATDPTGHFTEFSSAGLTFGTVQIPELANLDLSLGNLNLPTSLFMDNISLSSINFTFAPVTLTPLTTPPQVSAVTAVLIAPPSIATTTAPGIIATSKTTVASATKGNTMTDEEWAETFFGPAGSGGWFAPGFEVHEVIDQSRFHRVERTRRYNHGYGVLGVGFGSDAIGLSAGHVMWEDTITFTLLPGADIWGIDAAGATLTYSYYIGKVEGGFVVYTAEQGLGLQMVPPTLANQGFDTTAAINIGDAVFNFTIALNIYAYPDENGNRDIIPLPSAGGGAGIRVHPEYVQAAWVIFSEYGQRTLERIGVFPGYYQGP